MTMIDPTTGLPAQPTPTIDPTTGLPVIPLPVPPVAPVPPVIDPTTGLPVVPPVAPVPPVIPAPPAAVPPVPPIPAPSQPGPVPVPTAAQRAQLEAQLQAQLDALRAQDTAVAAPLTAAVPNALVIGQIVKKDVGTPHEAHGIVLALIASDQITEAQGIVFSPPGARVGWFASDSVLPESALAAL